MRQSRLREELMLSNTALIVPSERPPTSAELKRALFSFEHIVLIHPEDRDLIPAHTYVSATGFPFPIGMPTGRVRPLGKSRGYDDGFERVLEDIKLAERQGHVRLLARPEQSEARMTLGAVLVPEGTPDPRWVFQVYRALAQDPAWVKSALGGIEPISAREEAEELCLPSADDGTLTTYLDGQSVSQSRPLAAVLMSGWSEEDARLAAKVAHARLGAVVKSFGYSQLNGMVPLATHHVTATILARLGNQIRSASWSSDADLTRRLSQIHNMLIVDEVDASAIDGMTTRELLKLRTRAWGRYQEGRLAFLRVLRQISTEELTDESFSARIREEIARYRTLQENYESDRRGLQRSALKTGVGTGLTTTLSTLAAGAIAHDLSALLVGVATAISSIGAGSTALWEGWSQVRASADALGESLSFALVSPYEELLSLASGP
ncbi:MAG TPA: hypothetical protein ENH00_06400 [Actinobacteria bacterium]|nr:hypothetical protein BMS3Bbin01_02057 [bacterium BMS3Bbin01]HDH25810.1 hypothetical protein [Actinomycetota bacterium]